MKGRKTPGKIVVEEVDVVRENAMEGVEVAGEDGGFVGGNAAEGELTTRSKALKQNT